jgi:hypothetical protein
MHGNDMYMYIWYDDSIILVRLMLCGHGNHTKEKEKEKGIKQQKNWSIRTSCLWIKRRKCRRQWKDSKSKNKMTHYVML